MIKQVTLKINREEKINPDKSSENKYTVILDFYDYEGRERLGQRKVELPSISSIETILKEWQESYREFLSSNSGDSSIRKIEVEPEQITRMSCQETEDELIKELNNWLDHTPHGEGMKLRDILESECKLNVTDEVHIIVETSDDTLRQIPWQLSSLFTDYKNLEFALSNQEYKKKCKIKKKGSKVEILVILGDSTNIDTDEDAKLIAKLEKVGAKITLLRQPELDEIKDTLLDDKNQFKILFFAGHSSSQNEATIGINANKSICIEVLKEELTHAVEKGLKLAIFNSCDGLGLAKKLTSLIPYIVVMREAITNLAAQKFLEFFLDKFTKEKETNSINISVRHAREELQKLNDDAFKCASLLPTIFQNPYEEIITWKKLRYGEQKDKYKSFISKAFTICLLPIFINYLTSLNIIQLGKGAGINFDLYCEQKYGSEFKSDPGKRNDPNSWYCYNKSNKMEQYKIAIEDIKTACQQQNNSSIVYLVGEKTIWDWKCFTLF